MGKRIVIAATGLACLLFAGACEPVTDSVPEREKINEPTQTTYSTVVKGHQSKEGIVNGQYKARYLFDAHGDYYFDLGDGRTQGVGHPDQLDAATLSTCNYVVIYRGDFGEDPFLDNGWVRNNIRCTGYAYPHAQTYNSLYVHNTDPRYREELEPIWGTWGILVDAVGGSGNAANPKHPVNN